MSDLARDEAAETYRVASGWSMAEGRAVVDAFVAGSEWQASRPVDVSEEEADHG